MGGDLVLMLARLLGLDTSKDVGGFRKCRTPEASTKKGVTLRGDSASASSSSGPSSKYSGLFAEVIEVMCLNTSFPAQQYFSSRTLSHSITVAGQRFGYSVSIGICSLQSIE